MRRFQILEGPFSLFEEEDGNSKARRDHAIAVIARSEMGVIEIF
jgi:hypothetical protein